LRALSASISKQLFLFYWNIHAKRLLE